MRSERRGEVAFGGVAGLRARFAPGRLAATFLAAPLALAATLFAADAWPKAPAKARPTVAGVEVHAAGLGPSVAVPLRRGAEGEARRLAWKGLPGGERVVLSTSLVRLGTTRRPGGPRVNAVVAVSVLGAERGDVKAVIEGSAEVRGEGAWSRGAAVEAAARGAVRNVPRAMRLAREGAKAPKR
jgi:hypothetical protein